MTAERELRRYLPDTETLAWGGLLVTTEFLLVVGYILLLGIRVRDWRLYVVPFVWINVSLWAFVRTDPAPASDRKRLIAGVVAGGYFLLLAYFGGLIGPSGSPVRSLSVSLTSLPPGWSPALQYNGDMLSVVLLPYKLVGYLALAYLVYATALDAASALLGGVLGLFSCVSCSFPLVAGLLTGIAGSGGALAAGATAGGYLLSSGVFIITVGLLAWRPTPALVDGVRSD